MQRRGSPPPASSGTFGPLARRVASGALALLLFAVAARLTATSFGQAGFSETVVFTGLTNPTAVRFLPDGSVLVAEKSGLLKLFPDINTNTYTVVADLRNEVHNFWDRGLLGLAIDPNFTSNHFVYVLYTYDAPIGGTPPKWGPGDGTSDGCPSPPGATTDGCVVSGRLSRLTATGSSWTASETSLINDWCQQFPSHSIGSLGFGSDGYLYVSGGDGASFNNDDWGQYGGTSGVPPPTPKNPCGDPPAGVGGNETPPTAEGGSLRSQSPQRAVGEPRLLNGSILRVDPATGAGVPGNPFFGSGDLNARRIIAYGLRNPFRFTIKPGTNDIWVGDVGYNVWEEIDRIPDLSSARNFGWPCYEGPGPLPSWQGDGLAICTNLYASGTAVAPFFSYSHSSHPVANDNCPTGSSAIAGLAFYTGGSNYPSSYNNALFVTDHSRACVWVMFPGSGGDPDPSTISAFSSATGQGPVDLEVGPDGNVYYVDFDGGKISKFVYGLNAVATATPTGGVPPLTVTFDGSASVPALPGDTLTYDWDLDGDGQYNDAQGGQVTWVYTTSGTFAARLRVTDQRGSIAYSAPMTITTSASFPTPTILTPSPSLTWKVGDTISFSGQATDPQDGNLPPSALSWTVLIHHCPSNCHTHTYQTFSGVASGSFPAPDHEYPSYLEIQLTATDSGGLQSTTSVSIQPLTVDLSLQSVPSGLTLTIATFTGTTPFVRTEIVNSGNTLTAPSPQGSYQFTSWSDGGAQTHSITAPSSPTTYTATYSNPGSLPPPWVDQDVGGVGLAGFAGYAGGTFTASGSGVDIWDTADGFHYVYQPLNGDGTIVARVATQQNTDPWAKSGVMIRETLGAGSTHASLFVTPGNGLAFQRRLATGGVSTSTQLLGPAVPYWVKLTRAGNTFTAYGSPDGVTWTLVAADSVPMAASVLVGLADTAHNNTLLCASSFDNVAVSPGVAPPPAPWATQDVGAPGVAGAATYSGTTFTLDGSGTDIWVAPDQFRFVYQPLSGDGTVVARVTGLQNTNVWAKAGVMIRESLAANSTHASMFLTPGNGVSFQRRLTTGAVPLSTTVLGPAAPYWLKVVRAGTTFTGYSSTDGVTWTLVGSDTVAMAANVQIGLVMTSHANTTLGAATIDQVTVTGNGSPTPTPTATPTSTATFTAIPTATRTLTPSTTPTQTFTPASTSTPSGTPTATATPTATRTFTSTPTLTRTLTPSATPTITSTPSRTPTPVFTSTPTPTATVTSTPSRTPSWTPTPPATATPTPGASPTPTPGPNGIPVAWADEDIGAPSLPGGVSVSNGTFTVTGSGADIETTSDQFHFVQGPLSGDGTILVRVASVQNTNPWAKAGVMIRETLAPNSAHAMMVLTPGNGLAFQRRTTTGGTTLHTPGANVVAPYWVRLVRAGNTFTGYSSPDGVTWTLVGSDTIPMATSVYAGLALTSHDNTLLATATMDGIGAPPTAALTTPAPGASFGAPATVLLTAGAFDTGAGISKVDFFNGGTLLGTDTTPPYTYSWTGLAAGVYTATAQVTDGLSRVVTSAPVTFTVDTAGTAPPAPWIDQDVGTPAGVGSVSSSSGTFTVKGAGIDIWDFQDHFHFVYQPMTGNATVVARVATVQNTDPWAKAGVMIRESLAPGSTHAMMVMTPGNGLAFQRRLSTNAASLDTAGAIATAPYWVKVVRSGNVFTGYQSTDGATWVQVDTATIPMASTVYVGLVLTSHADPTVATATIDGVAVSSP